MVDDTFDWHGHKFEGVVSDPKLLKTQPGIYLVWADKKVLDIGEAGDVQARVSNHDRKDCWQRHATGGILYGAHYMPRASEQERRDLEANFRAMDDYPCGKR